MSETVTIPTLYSEWESAWVPYQAALATLNRADAALFTEPDSAEKLTAQQEADDAVAATEAVVVNREARIFSAPAASLADVLLKLRVAAKTIGRGNGKIEGPIMPSEELVLRLLADLE
ncbi:MAG TPA: hypothetical protein VKU84_02180, partial [Stellaceae bacterium]|nr:hypothetical protein [Stellaceae bacterium]